MSQHGRIKMKKMDSDLQWTNRNKSRSSIKENLSSLAVHPLQSLIPHPNCTNYTQGNPLGLTKCCSCAQEAEGFLKGLQCAVEQEGTWSCHPVVTQGLAWIALLRKALLTSPDFATLTLRKQLRRFRRGVPGVGSQQMQVASCSQ